LRHVSIADRRRRARIGIGVSAIGENYRCRPARETAKVSSVARPSPDLVRYGANLQGEVDGAYLYRTLAALEAEPALAEVYSRLAESEERHALVWAEKLRGAGVPAPPGSPSRRARVLAWLARRFGPQFVLPTLVELEEADRGRYDSQPEARAAGLPAAERSHARLLGEVSGGVAGSALARFEGRHRGIGGNALRAAVLGANDGLLSNFSLVMGVAGASLAGSTILITGLAGLLAGAGSMALGEWISVQSSRELYERQIAIERAELEAVPEEEEEELALIYQAKGLTAEAARDVASRLMANREQALDTLAREELGIEPGELGGSSWEAALTSFALFAVGAIVPVVPYFFVDGWTGVAVSAAASCFALFGIGAAITLMTGRSVLYSGGRQLLFGVVAAAITYGIGRALDVAVG
jgi:VIT1/CCC1 family predicted Fe2+/Mn2+ transporter